MTAKIDMTGRVCGQLTVLRESHNAYWVCRCACGTEKVVWGTHLRNGNVKSCGCLRVEMGRERAKRDAIGGYKGYAKYKTAEDYLANTTRVGGCMEWNGRTYTNGYAKFPENSRIPTTVGHRAIYMLTTGEDPPIVRHTCDNRKCINPDHLVAGTQRDNMADKVARKRDLHTRKLTEDQARSIRTRFAAGESSVALGREFGVAKQTVLSIVHRRVWASVQ